MDSNSQNKKSWNLIIGITLVLFGSLRLYNKFQQEDPSMIRIILTIGFIGYGGFLIYNHFSNSDTDQ
ncbi:hypothetical protein [Aquimarina rhabdastrellae]